MAKKKTSKKAAKAKPAQKSSKKSATKAASRKSGGTPKDIRKVGTGGGASAGEVGRTLVEMFNKGQIDAIEKMFWSPSIVSCEGEGVAMEWVGRKSATRKNSQWQSQHRLHGASAEGPFVGATGFAVKFKMDVESLADGKRIAMEEVGVYTIRGGKITREEFMYGGGPTAA